MGLSKRFLEKFEWWRFVPAEDKVYNDPQIDKFRSSIAAEIPEELIIFYFNLPVGPKSTVALNEAKIVNLKPGDKYEVTLFNPIYGGENECGIHTADENGVLKVNTCILHDWVIVLKKV